ncbi:PDZ domain-containing protein [Pimelobacter simplex]|uniref:PDZ domain-containing protein n=1 Tax=Nocardioides simplex TaxID=2045 RepID=A0A7J5DUV1_NOCSI|nr:trypsin-like peptidase domain-containing protein [Pimelobacter simplex]KAB2809103.1 PDZ domain-containing protein [Pimelobacter simplex]
MNDAHEPDREPSGPEPTEPTEPTEANEPAEASPWAPPGATAVPLAESAPLAPPSHPAPEARPEPTTPLPMAPSLLPPPPSVPPTAADLTVRFPGSGGPGGLGGPGGPPAPGSHRSGRPAGWMWPAIAALALVVGLGGGVLGALVYDKVADDAPSGPAYSDQGLGGVDLEKDAPLAAPGSVAAVAQAVLPSTVQIIADYKGQSAGASGSGWVLDKNGHIVTNNHVVADAAKNGGEITVLDHERNRYRAKVVGRSPVYDLAVLYVEKHDKLTPAKLGYSSKLQVGEPVVAIGSPLNLPDTVTSGIVSYLHRPVTTGASADESSYIDAVQTDAAINPGNSGGPLVNQKGEVIGVNSAIATAGGGSIDSEAGNIGVGFAIPVEQVRVTADQILKTGKAQYPLIGANVRPNSGPDGKGAVLESIQKGSPASKAGLQADDVILAVNGQEVYDSVDLVVVIRTHQPGEKIELTLERRGKSMKVEVELAGKDG